jgi:hypothetical protein
MSYQNNTNILTVSKLSGTYCYFSLNNDVYINKETMKKKDYSIFNFLKRSLVLSAIFQATWLVAQAPPNVPSYLLPTTCYNDIRVPLGDNCEAILSVGSLTNAEVSTPVAAVCSDNIPRYTADSVKFVAFASDQEVPGQICEGDSKYNGGQQGVTDVCPESTELLMDTVYGEGNWMYGIYLWDHEKDCWELSCWGRFVTEDKVDPRFYGDTVNILDVASTPVDESMFNQYGTYKEVSFLTWDGIELDSPEGNEFVPGNWSCYQSTAHPDLNYSFPHDSVRYYDTLTIVPTLDGTLTIIAESKINDSDETHDYFDVVTAAYGKGGFDADNPCQNLLSVSESSFIPNPLAGLGFANALQNSSINGAQQDSANIFAPWLLHNAPVARMSIKANANQAITILVTHRENQEDLVNNPAFQLYFMFDSYDHQGLNSPKFSLEEFTDQHDDSLYADTAFAYFDFICPDIETVMVDHQETLDQTSYLGGSYGDLVFWYNAMSGDSIPDSLIYNSVPKDSMLALGSGWRKYAAALLTDVGNDTVLFNSQHYDYGIDPYDLYRPSHAAARAFMNDTLLFHYGYMPMVIENCDTWEVKVTDALETLGDCGYEVLSEAQNYNLLNNVGAIITRTFVVADAGSKTDLDTAQIQLIFRNPSLYDIRLPHYTVNIACEELESGEVTVLAENGHPSPASTGYPFVATLTGFEDLTPTNAVCNLAAGYEDYAEVTSCANNQSFRREWTVYDWCRPGTTIVYHQLIRVGDWTAPTKTAAGSVTFEADADGCTGTVVVEAPEYSDLCGTVSLSAKVYRGQPSINNEIGYFGVEAGGSGELTGQEYGTYYVVWTANDDCGNAAAPDTLHDTFSDFIAPSCVIDDLRSITLTDYGNIGSETAIDAVLERGQAWVTAERLDEGSWDNCGSIDSIHVRRMTDVGMSAWADAISFTCEDEGVAVLVELRVKDEAGNETICWTNITPVDKTQPECRDIGTVDYFCDELPSGDDLSGTSAVWGQFFDDSLTLVNISKDELCHSNMEVFDTEVHIDQCGYGYVNRYYRVFREIDGKEFADSCRMSIVFSENHEYSITFPADVAESCTELSASGITYVEGGCDLITVSIKDETFDATADECYKIFRTFNVINWCEYEEESVSPFEVSRWDWDGDGKEGDGTTVNVNYKESIRHIFTDYQGGGDRDTILNAGVTTNPSSTNVYWESQFPMDLVTPSALIRTRHNYGYYSVVNSTNAPGYFQYTQVLKVYDDEEPTITYTADQDSFPSFSNAEGCPGDVVITASLDDDCTSDINQVTVTEAYLDADNDAGAESVDFDAAVMADISQADGQVTYTGTDIPAGTHRLRLVARDGCGNVREEDHVFTVYDAKGPAPICIEGFAVELMPNLTGTGGIATVQAEDFVINNPIADCSGAVSSFEITRVTTDIDAILAADDLAGSLTLLCSDLNLTEVAVVATDAAGNADYCITTITVQNNLIICDDSGANITGIVTTEDNNVVSGVEISLNADKNIVTNVDGSYFFTGLTLGEDYTIAPRKDGDYLNGVTTYDLVLISKHILGVTPLASPYQLIAADVNNSNSITTLDLIQLRKLILSVDTRLANNTSWRFVPADYSFPVASNPWAAAFPEVLNINDFNGTANGDFVAIKVGDVNNSALIDVQPRSNASFALNVEDLTVKAGNEYTVSFKATAADVEGFQFALSFEGLELVDIVEGEATADNFGTKFTGEGVLLTSWNGTAAEGELFSLVFRATQDVVLSEALSVSTRHLNAEAYNTAGEAMNVAINFNSGAVAAANFELKQNTPNPFKGETVIGFNLAEASQATLTINDVTGRVLKVVKGDFAKGANQVSIDSKELPATGVLYYTLTAGAYTATKKMIIIE